MASNAENVSTWWRHHDPDTLDNPSIGVDSTVTEFMACYIWMLMKATDTLHMTAWRLLMNTFTMLYFYMRNFLPSLITICIFQCRQSVSNFAKCFPCSGGKLSVCWLLVYQMPFCDKAQQNRRLRGAWTFFCNQILLILINGLCVVNFRLNSGKKTLPHLCITWHFHHRLLVFCQGPVSICDKTSYRKISWSLDATRFVFRIVRSLWNLTALLPMCPPNFKAMR